LGEAITAGAGEGAAGSGCAGAANGVTAKDSAPAILRYGETKVFPPVNRPHKAMIGTPYQDQPERSISRLARQTIIAALRAFCVA
jgi:hypothetical protein